MPTQKKTPSTGVQIKVSDVNNVSGDVIIGAGSIKVEKHTHVQNTHPDQVLKALNKASHAINQLETLTQEQKDSLKADVKEAKKAIDAEKVDTPTLEERFRKIARMAPDILDVILAGLVNPVAGVAMTVKKIAEKAKESVDVVK